MTQKKLLALVIIVIVLGFVTVKTILFFTAEPKVTVDYVAEYNKITLPQDYDPNKNGAPYYQKAFDAFIKMPDELWIPYFNRRTINWPTDFNDSEQTLLEKWLVSNTLAFQYFREGSAMPYYWIKRVSTKDNVVNYMMFPDDSELRKIAKAIIWNAKLEAAEGHFHAAFENSLDCYRVGNQKCHSNPLLMEQYIGLGIKDNCVRGALTIFNKLKVENESLRFLQNALEEERQKDNYLPYLDTEKLRLYDIIQRIFVDNGKGTGRLAFEGFPTIISTCCGEPNVERVWLNSFFGPTRNETVEQIGHTIQLYEQVKNKTPWQIHQQGLDNFEQIRNINNKNFMLKWVGLDPRNIFRLCYELRAETDGLITVLALLRYKADTGQYPESLEKLVSAGYLKFVPMDPYSDGPLVYKVTENNFKLYSVGENFKDDGGTVNNRTEADIIYWPVQKLEKPIQKTGEPNQQK